MYTQKKLKGHELYFEIELWSMPYSSVGTWTHVSLSFFYLSLNISGLISTFYSFFTKQKQTHRFMVTKGERLRGRDKLGVWD